MRSNSNKMGTIVRNSKTGELIKRAGGWLIQRLSWELRLTANYLSLGMRLRQWTALCLICLLLLPMFVAPASGATNFGINPTDIQKEELPFEPVNAPQSVLQSLKQKFDVSIEGAMTNVFKPENIYSVNNINLSKNADDKEIGNEKAVSSEDDKNASKKEDNVATSENSKSPQLPESKLNNTVESSTTAERQTDNLTNTDTDSIKNKNNSGIISNQLSAQPLMMQIERPVLDETEIPVLVSPQNNLGNPIGQTEAQSAIRPSATRTVERSGIGNFSFGFPVVSIPGRGIDAGVGATYNSQVWTKSGSNYIFNVDGNWLSPGFQIGYGYLDAYREGTAVPSTFVLTEPDGTRRRMDHVSGNGGTVNDYLYESNDGSFTQVQFWHCGGCSQTGLLDLRVTYSDGTKIFYSASNSQNRFFPTKIVDVQGNYITIAYLANDQVGKISTITDTLGRVITFHYDNTTDQKLIAVSVPGYNNSTTPRIAIRFYYETLTLQTANRFDGTITAPASVPVLRHIYMPGSKTGYRYDYSSYYGMIYKVTQLHGMEVSNPDNTSEMGSVTNTSTYVEAASTRYNYAGTDITPPSPTLTDVPKYNARTDDWIGRTGSVPVTTYGLSEDASTKTTQTTAPDNTATVTVSIKNPGQWNDGLVKETYVTSPGRATPWMRAIYKWQEGDITRGRKNPRIEKIETINEAGQSKATTFVYDLYNNPISIKEHDFASTEQLGTELRRTETTYQTSGTNNPWIARNLVNLPVSVKIIVNNTVVSRTDFEYDNYQNNALAETPGVAQHDKAYNPYTTETTQVRGDCKTWYTPPYGSQVCSEYYINTVPVYNSATNYRGNITKVTSFVDVANDNDPNASVSKMKYDITGNVVQSTLNCCNLQIVEYSADYEYAYPTKVTKGSGVQLLTQAVYDFNTGLLTKNVNENNQEMAFEYESDTLRQKKVVFPNGGYTETEYSDKLVTGSSLVPGFIRTKTTLDSSHTAQSYNYFDARGLNIRSATQTTDEWSVSAVMYDNFGRPQKSYNPFYTSTPNGDIAVGTKYTEVVNYDALGRTTKVKLQDESFLETFFNEAAVIYTDADNQPRIGTVSRVKDQADKERRQIVDALGRIIRVDEPTDEGLGSPTAPTQPTFYYYDGNDNLSRVVQKEIGGVTQERKFKYDSLSRLTHEKQVEATPTLDAYGVYGVPDPNNWTKVLKYDNLGRMVEATDARGVKTNFVEFDGLNRILKVTFSDGTPQVLYNYDQPRNDENGNPYSNKGNLTRIETADGGTNRPNTPVTTTEFDYDKMGRVAAHRQTIGSQTYNLEYGYNLAGKLTLQKYPSGKIVAMSYDTSGKLSGVTDQGRTYLSNLQYGSHGGALSQMTLGNGIQQSLIYNDRLQIEKMTWAKNGNIVQRYDYTIGELNSQNQFKNNGKLAQIDSYNGGSVTSPTKQFTQKFDYDAVGRLKSETEFRGDNNQQSYKQIFDYDRFGNRYLKVADNPSNQNPLLPTPIEENNIDKAKNQLVSNTGTTYDDAGNVTTDGKFRLLKYAYDANGRMYRTSSMDDVNQANSVYDASGQRVATQINGVWKFFVYDAFGKIVAEYGGTPATDEGGVKYVHQDVQGSTRAITSVSGAVKARMDYQAFGEEISANVGQRTAQGYSSSDSLRQKYALTERDEASGLDHTWFRKHENRAGRWTSPDPYNGSMSIGNPQSFNRYSYVENDPLNFVDPSGLNMCSAEYSFEQCGGSDGFWGRSDSGFGDSYAFWYHPFEGMSAGTRDSVLTYIERVNNSIAGYGFLSNSEVWGALQAVFEIEYKIFDDGSIWTNFVVHAGTSTPAWYERGALGRIGTRLEGFANGVTGGIPDGIDYLMGRERNVDRDSPDYKSAENGGAVLGIILPTPGGKAKATSKGANLIQKYLGAGAKGKLNKAGDLVIVSADGTKRVRFDFIRPHPHTNPHAHVEELINGNWVKSGQIYPFGVPPF
jgi:RHS repeat-associated protein